MFGGSSGVTRNVKFGEKKYIRKAPGLSIWGSGQLQEGVSVWLEEGERSILCVANAYY